PRPGHHVDRARRGRPGQPGQRHDRGGAPGQPAGELLPPGADPERPVPPGVPGAGPGVPRRRPAGGPDRPGHLTAPAATSIVILSVAKDLSGYRIGWWRDPSTPLASSLRSG